MHLKLLSALLVLMYLTQAACSDDFKYKNSECKYFEDRLNKGKGPRALQIDCAKLNLHCRYKGNPHGCNWYNTKGNQPKFYKGLIDKLVKDGKVCTEESVEYKKCKGQEFKLEKKQIYEDIEIFGPEDDMAYIEDEDLEFRPYV